MSKHNIFTPGDFTGLALDEEQEASTADRANAKLAKLLTAAPTIYTYNGKPDVVGVTWNLKRLSRDTPVSEVK